jgi:hypothetical protein
VQDRPGPLIGPGSFLATTNLIATICNNDLSIFFGTVNRQMFDSNPSVETILALLRPNASAAAVFQSPQAVAVDWDDLAVTAIALGLAPLVHFRLASQSERLPQDRAQAKLDFMRQTELARHTARQAQLAELLARLPTAPVVLKGAYLAERVYPAPGLRPMNDIDLLFRPEDLPAVSAALDELGYGSKEKSAEQGPGITKHTSTFKRAGGAASTPNPYLSSGGSHMVEPHRSLEESWFGLRCDLTPGMWQRSQPIEIAGQPARALLPSDNFLHLCVHLAFHLIMGSPLFVQMADLAVFAQYVPIDWDDFCKRAAELRAAGYALAAAGLAARVLAAPIPSGVLDRLERASPATVRAAAANLTVADILRRTQRPPLRTIRQRLRRGVADRTETARWAHSGAEWLRIWWTLVDIRRTDTWQMLRPAQNA